MHDGEVRVQGMENVHNPNTHFCLDCNNPKSQDGIRMGIFPCHGQGGNQYFQFTKLNDLRLVVNKNCNEYISLAHSLKFQLLKFKVLKYSKLLLNF